MVNLLRKMAEGDRMAKKDDLAETTGNISTEINGGDFSIYSPNGSIDLSTPFEVFYKSWGRCGKKRTT